MYKLIPALANAVSTHSILRLCLIGLAVLGAVFFLIPMVFRIVNIGNLFGLAVSLIVLVFSLLSKWIAPALSTCCTYKAGRITLNAVTGIILLGMLYCLAMTCLMLHGAHKKPKSEPAAIIVLGCKVRGTEPSLMLYRRIQRAYQALQTYPDAAAVVSGGKGYAEEISEAECMRRELCAMGIPETRILLEDQSTSTSENLRFSKQILDANGISGELVLVTDAYHEKRAQILAKKEGLPPCSAASAHTSWYLVPTYWVREWFGLAHAFAFGT